MSLYFHFSQMRSLAACLGLALGFCGCATDIQVKTAHDPSAQFSEFKSFAMLLPNKALPSKNAEVDPFVMQRLRQLTYLQLKQLGMLPVEKSEADLLVAVFARRSQRIDVYPSTYSGYGYGPGWGYGYGYGPGFGASVWSSQVVRTDEGIVVLDLIDRKSKAVVWRGTGVRAVEPDFDDEMLQEIVSAILAQSPFQNAP